MSTYDFDALLAARRAAQGKAGSDTISIGGTEHQLASVPGLLTLRLVAFQQNPEGVTVQQVEEIAVGLKACVPTAAGDIESMGWEELTLLLEIVTKRLDERIGAHVDGADVGEGRTGSEEASPAPSPSTAPVSEETPEA